MTRRRRAWTWILLSGLLGLTLLPAAGAEARETLRLPLPRALAGEGPYGGDLQEARWLPACQRPDGHWSAMDWDRWYRRAPLRLDPRPTGRARRPHDTAVTALALCAFLGHGYTNRGRHPYAKVVARGLRWLKRRQLPSGSFVRAGEPDPVAAHALATLAMSEAYGMTGSLIWRGSCQASLEHLLALRGTNGAWQRPGTTEDDALATFWAAMPLKSAELINKDTVKRGKEAPIALDAAAALKRILAWFATRTDAATGIVRASAAERARGTTDLVLTAAGALVRVFAGEDPRKAATLRAALDHLGKHPPTTDPRQPESDGLYVYIGTLATFQAGGETYDTWRRALRAVTDAQLRDPTLRAVHGSWDPRGPWMTDRGRVAMTALATMTLSVFYRYHKVFGGMLDEAELVATAMAPPTGALPAPRLDIVRGVRTWKRSALPIHAARMTLARGGSLPIDAAHLRAEVHGGRAQVVLDLFVTNTNPRQHEGVLDLHLPEGAAPYYLAFGEAQLAKVPIPGADGAVGTDLASLEAASAGAWGRVLEARMAPVAAATEAFETIVRKRRDPALLTWSGAGMFHLRVFPLLPAKQHRIVVAYEVDLARVGDGAELRLDLPRDVHDLRVAVRAPGADWFTEPSAPEADGVRSWHEPGVDTIRVRIATLDDTWLTGTDAAGREHSAAWVRPDVPRVPRTASTHARFLVDVSQSAAADSMHVWRALVPAILEANRDRLSTFAVGFFDLRTAWWRDGPVDNTPANVAALRATFDTLEPGGATDLAGALAAARQAPKGTDVFLFTDGVATWGAAARRAILAEVGRDRPVFAYATGLAGEDRDLLADIALHSGGALVTVLGAADVAEAARAHRFHPWRIEALAIPGVRDLLVGGSPTRIHPGQRLRLAGRGAPAPGEQLFLRLRQGDRQHTLHVPVPEPIRSPMAARAYGHAGVQRLEAAGPAVRDLARDYATHFRVVRKSCALVMLESEQDYQRFGLDGTGHAARVAARPVLTALATQPTLRSRAAGVSLAAFARTRQLPPALVDVLAVAAPEALTLPPGGTLAEPDPVLRGLAGALDGGAASARGLALHAYGRGLPAHAAAVLLAQTKRRSTSDPATEWLLARAADQARRPLLALVGYEAALGGIQGRGHGEILWVIAADYERYLRRFLAGRRASGSTRFAQARLESLQRWRAYLAGFAPPATAALVVLHQPFDPKDHVEVEVRGPRGVVEDAAATGARYSNLRRIPEDPQGAGPQLTALRALGHDVWTLRLVRPEGEEAQRPTGRSLVVVIRDWGMSSERIELVRSLGPDDGPVLLRLQE